MKNLLTAIPIFLSMLSIAQDRQKNIEQKLYLTQIKAAESLLRLNETGDAKKILEETSPSLRGFEWQLLNAMSDRSIQTLRGHSKAVVGLALSADGKWLASGSADSSIIIWDAITGNRVATLAGHKGQVSSLDFSPDGKQLLSGSTDRTMKLWDVPGKTEITTLRKDFFRGIYQCKFSPDGKKAGMVSWEFVQKKSPPVQGFAVVLSLTDGEVIQRFNTDSHPASAIDFSGDGNKIYTATWGFHIKQHDIATGKDEWDYDVSNVGYYTAFQSCDLSPDGKLIVTGGKDNQVRMLDAANGKLVYSIEPAKGHSKWVNAVRFSGDGRLFASASDDQLIKVWEAASGKLLYTFRGHTNNISGLVFSNDNSTLFSASADGTIKKWSITNPGQFSFNICRAGPWSAPLDPTGTWFAAACSDTVLNVWNVQQQKIEQSYSGISAIAAAVSPDGKWLASGNMKLNIFDLQAKKMIAAKAGHRARITGMAWLASKSYIATASSDGTIRIWNNKGDSINSIISKTGGPYSIAFTPDQKKMIVGMNNGKVKYYDTNSWNELDSLQSGTTIFDLKIDPAGKYMATSGDKGQLFLWDLQKKKQVQLTGHSNDIYGIAFHPNGKYLLSSSYDLSVKVWDVATGNCVLTLKEFTGALYTVSVTPNGKTLVVTEAEGPVYVFNL